MRLRKNKNLSRVAALAVAATMMAASVAPAAIAAAPQKEAEVPAAQAATDIQYIPVYVTYVDEETGETVGTETALADRYYQYGSAILHVGNLTLPDNCEVVGETGDVNFTELAATVESLTYAVTVRRKAPQTKTIYITFHDVDTDTYFDDVDIGEYPVTATEIDASVVEAHMPEGYEFVASSYKIADKYVAVDIQKKAVTPATKTLYIEFVDEATGEAVGEGTTLEVAKDAVNANYSAVTAPDGYEFCESGDFAFGNNVTVSLKVRKVVTTKTVKINFYSESEEKQVKEAPLTVAKDATYINTSALADIMPEGYELVVTGDLTIRDGYVYVAVKPVANTKTIIINFYDETADKQLKEETLTVAKDAEKIGATDIEYPEGYEVNKETTSYIIRDGYVYIGLKQVATTKTININYVDEATGKSVGKGTLVVDKDATYANFSQLTTPDGYVTCEQGDFSFNGKDTVDVKVRKVTETKTIAVEFVTEDGETVGKGSLVVDKDATYANYASLTTPDGYVTCEAGDFYFGDSLTVTIKVRKVVETKTVYIEYVDEKTNKTVGYEKLVVEKNATYANYSALKEVPEGYETCEVGDFSFNGGVTVTLKVRKIATTKTIYINFYSEDEEKQIKESPLTVAADATYINTSLLTDDIPEGYELCEVGDLFIRDGYVYAAVRKVETPAPVPQTKTVTVFLTCEKGGFFHNLIHHVLKGESYITTVTVEVDADATQVFASDISAYVPAGHKLTANAATITAGSLAEFIVK